MYIIREVLARRKLIQWGRGRERVGVQIMVIYTYCTDWAAGAPQVNDESMRISLRGFDPKGQAGTGGGMEGEIRAQGDDGMLKVSADL